MTTRHDDAGNLTALRLSLKRAGFVMQKGGSANQTQYVGKLRATVTVEGSHVIALRLSLANASNKEVK